MFSGFCLCILASFRLSPSSLRQAIWDCLVRFLLLCDSCCVGEVSVWLTGFPDLWLAGFGRCWLGGFVGCWLVGLVQVSYWFVCDPLLVLWCWSGWYVVGMSMCLFIAGFCKVCHASLNSRASLVFPWFNTFTFVQSNLWSFSMTCFAGIDRTSSRLMVFLCSVLRDLMVFDVSPM